jgi:hypothetical protein
MGISADIQIRRDGSGRMILEYRFSRMAETIGRLDGNERWQIIPTGRADMERTVARIPGMRLVSFSSNEDTKDIVNKVTLDFDNAQALLKFLDPSGKRAKLENENGLNRLQFILNEPVSSQINPDLLALMKQMSAGYKTAVSFSADKNAQMTITDGEGNAIAPPAGSQVVPSGRKVSLSIDTGEILSFKQGLGLIIVW